MCGRGWHAWWGDMHGRGACVAGGHAWQGGHAWPGGMCGRGHAWQGGMHGREGVLRTHRNSTRKKITSSIILNLVRNSNCTELYDNTK